MTSCHFSGVSPTARWGQEAGEEVEGCRAWQGRWQWGAGGGEEGNLGTLGRVCAPGGLPAASNTSRGCPHLQLKR